VGLDCVWAVMACSVGVAKASTLSRYAYMLLASDLYAYMLLASDLVHHHGSISPTHAAKAHQCTNYKENNYTAQYSALIVITAISLLGVPCHAAARARQLH
jgi:hypothetical protein